MTEQVQGARTPPSERLRSHRAIMDRGHGNLTVGPDEDCEEAADLIDEMLAALEAVIGEWREGYGLRCKPQVDAAIRKARGQA